MITSILSRHKCFGYYPELEEYKKNQTIPDSCKNYVNLSTQLLDKWLKYIPNGWYGFDIGLAPDSWYRVIDEFLDYLVTLDPNLQINQIKMKFGGIRFYVTYNCTNNKKARQYTQDKMIETELNEFIRLQINELERILQSESLIY